MIRTGIKEKLIKRIREIKDPELLQEIYSWLEDESQLDVYVTSEAQKKEIIKSQKQIENGEGISDDDANNEIDEWLKTWNSLVS